MSTAAVVTVSDGVSGGTRTDQSGDAVAAMLEASGHLVTERRAIADDQPIIERTLRELARDVDLIVTTGGTGFGPRDVTPEATQAVVDRDASGLAEAMRAAGRQSTPLASLSRSAAGVIGDTLVLNLPGSPRGATESLGAVLEIVPHALRMLSGDTGHDEAGDTARAGPGDPPPPTTHHGHDHDHTLPGRVLPESIEGLQTSLEGYPYLADRGLATSLYLALSLHQPILLEGEAGVGKTEVAKALASTLGFDLVRLQCYEGIDVSQALYEWDYARQLLYLRAIDAERATDDVAHDEIFGPRFLLERPLLRALRAGGRTVLLIDEIDRADDEFEAFLLEVLSDYQVTIPEIGTVAASEPPIVVLTSNRTRELHDALKRRCLYHWIDLPTPERELAIVMARAPEVPEVLAASVTKAVNRLRELDLIKSPGIAETIGWARAAAFLGITTIDREAAHQTLGAVIKDYEDLTRVRSEIDVLFDAP